MKGGEYKREVIIEIIVLLMEKFNLWKTILGGFYEKGNCFVRPDGYSGQSEGHVAIGSPKEC
ncbi:hypothetical protein TRIP_C20915 [Candidatus Zixiibacteriota bacterium]|nr:hypothetical protein TRIP_C20915 [candidate division Zixibacteria bacterium]